MNQFEPPKIARFGWSTPHSVRRAAGKPRQMEIFFPLNHDPSQAKVPGVILSHGGGLAYWFAGRITNYWSSSYTLS
jgi:hypothetical protein